MKSLSIIMMLVAIACLPSYSFSNTYQTDDGHTVELMWKVKHSKKIITWGSVRGGKKCNNLHIGIGLKNRRDGSSKYFNKDTNKKYYPQSGARFKFEKKYSYTVKKKGWVLDTLNVYCQDFHRTN